MKWPVKLFGGVRILDAPSAQNVERLDLGALPMIVAMQRKGLLVDIPHFEKLRAKYAQRMEELVEEVHGLTGTYCDLSSGDQVAKLLFNTLEIPTTGLKFTKSLKRVQVDEKSLMAIRDQWPELIDKMLDHRECEKLKGTYCEGIIRFTDKRTSRLHPVYKISSVETGRLACEDPNLLAIPARSEAGKELRAGFVAPAGKVLLSRDLSQIEIRMQAILAGVKAMIETYARNGDIHTETTARMFKVPFDQVTKDQRNAGKTTGLGVMYDISAEGLLWQFIKNGLGHLYNLEDCERFIQMYFDAYGEILEYRKQQYIRMRKYGYVWDIFGRCRWIPEVKSVHKWIQGAGMRAGANMPVQGSAQGIIKIAMAYIWYLIETELQLIGQADPLLQVHDELVFEVDKVIADDVNEIFGDAMNSVVPPGVFPVPILSSGSIGENLKEAK